MDRGTFSASSRAELIEIGRRLYEEALVRREDELITDPRGQPIGWLLDTRVPTLDGDLFTEVGMVLAERLRERGAFQIVGYGFGAHPLVCSVLSVDDGDGSGRSASEALTLLRGADFTVEGLLTLFNFTWSSGQARIEAEGLWVDSLLDLNLQEGTSSGSDSV
ncbi:MAG: orotate phosphoribosyltransferase [Bacteroidetes bacterium QH_2_64_26]|nr:MAG: orotate phosphoribosyltransferase [Bacteroidetes bacterium QH_2_64_26]